MSVIVDLGGPFAAATSLQYTAVLRDQSGNALPASSILTLTLTLFDTASGSIINSVNGVNILNTGRGTLDSSGNLTILFTTADTAISGSETEVQRSFAIFFTDTNGITGGHKVNFTLQSLTAAAVL